MKSTQTGAKNKKTRKRLSVEERRVEILEAGLSIFEDTPYEQVSIEDIAAQAGISMGLMYHYFPSKKVLYMEAYEHVASALVARCLQQASGSKWRFVEGCLDAYVDYAIEHPKAVLLVLRPGTQADADVKNFNDRLNDQIANVLASTLEVNISDANNLVALRAWVAYVDKSILEMLCGVKLRRDDFKKTALKVLRAAVA